MKTILGLGVCFVAVLIAGSDVRVGRTLGEESKKKSFCAASEYRQFDFWLGEWDAIEIGKTVPEAHAKITSVLDGCAIREEYDSADGYKGESLSIYDGSRKVWHQSWFTNRGQFLAIEGNFKDEEMVLTGADRGLDGRERRVQGIWKREGDGVRETAYRSTDGGKSWTQWFDLKFRPHKQ